MKILEGGLDNLNVKTAGIRNGKNGLALIVFDQVCKAEGVFTTNRMSAAPVQITRERIKNGIQAIVATSGNANCATGEQGLRDAESIAWKAAEELGIDEKNVAIASTGIIGEYLDTSLIKKQIEEGVKSLGKNSSKAAQAIMTTDTRPKELCMDFGRFKIAGIAKGSGMIHPHMATMLCFIVTDAEFEGGVLRKAVDETLNMVSVDNDMSTNDTVLLVSVGDKRVDGFAEALRIFLEEIAGMLIADGEGVNKLVEIRVVGAKNKGEARAAAHAIADSMLVKTSVFGNNANWGRVAAAVGYSGAEIDMERMKIWYGIGGKKILLYNGAAMEVDKEGIEDLMKKNDKIEIVVDLGLGDGEARAWSGDLSYEYVKINASYS